MWSGLLRQYRDSSGECDACTVSAATAQHKTDNSTDSFHLTPPLLPKFLFGAKSKSLHKQSIDTTATYFNTQSVYPKLELSPQDRPSASTPSGAGAGNTRFLDPDDYLKSKLSTTCDEENVNHMRKLDLSSSSNLLKVSSSFSAAQQPIESLNPLYCNFVKRSSGASAEPVAACSTAGTIDAGTQHCDDWRYSFVGAISEELPQQLLGSPASVIPVSKLLCNSVGVSCSVLQRMLLAVNASECDVPLLQCWAYHTAHRS